MSPVRVEMSLWNKNGDLLQSIIMRTQNGRADGLPMRLQVPGAIFDTSNFCHFNVFEEVQNDGTKSTVLFVNAQVGDKIIKERIVSKINPPTDLSLSETFPAPGGWIGSMTLNAQWVPAISGEMSSPKKP